MYSISSPIRFNGVAANDLNVLTGTIYGEARGCTDDAKENVAQCILNRYHTGWGHSVMAVCLAPWQFSSWNANDPNRNKILAAPTTDPENWKKCQMIASAALAGDNPDRINGADSYYARSMSTMPFWAKAPAVKKFEDAYHIFWKVRR